MGKGEGEHVGQLSKIVFTMEGRAGHAGFKGNKGAT